jgi:hypothetical protein
MRTNDSVQSFAAPMNMAEWPERMKPSQKNQRKMGDRCPFEANNPFRTNASGLLQ